MRKIQQNVILLRGQIQFLQTFALTERLPGTADEMRKLGYTLLPLEAALSVILGFVRVGKSIPHWDTSVSTEENIRATIVSGLDTEAIGDRWLSTKIIACRRLIDDLWSGTG